MLFGHQSHFEKYITKGFSPQIHILKCSSFRLNLLQGLTFERKIQLKEYFIRI